MDVKETILLKPKRVRKNPTRKWSVAEENSLIDFLMENVDVERPTPQIYYRRFAVEKGVAIEWSLVRSKVRNMRVSYNKAKAWEGSTGAGSMDGDTVKRSLFEGVLEASHKIIRNARLSYTRKISREDTIKI